MPGSVTLPFVTVSYSGTEYPSSVLRVSSDIARLLRIQLLIELNHMLFASLPSTFLILLKKLRHRCHVSFRVLLTSGSK